MSNGWNGSFPSAARRLRKSSNIVFQHLEWILAVDVRTPSRSNRTASKRPGVIGLCGGLMAMAPIDGWRQLARVVERAQHSAPGLADDAGFDCTRQVRLRRALSWL